MSFEFQGGYIFTDFLRDIAWVFTLRCHWLLVIYYGRYEQTRSRKFSRSSLTVTLYLWRF